MTPLVSQLETVRNYFRSGVTKDYDFRIAQLNKFKQAILKYEHEIQEALYKDLGKSAEESWVTETGFLLTEINETIRNLRKWMEPERVTTNLINLPSSSYVHREPLGVVLIIAPWNFPLQLLFAPLVGAIAAGNCAVLKPSEFAPHIADVKEKIVREVFDPAYVLYVSGDGAKVIPEMMNHFRFDHVFYTGSTMVGKIIYQMAAKELVPVTLELGGKSPCVVEDDANLKVAARRIAVTTFINAGQMCVAPDYILVHEKVKDAFVQQLTQTIRQFFSERPEESSSFGKIINEKQFDRLIGYMNAGKIIFGGRHDRSKLFIEPTLIENVTMEDAIMRDEIFGPILPIITFTDRDAAAQMIDQNQNPLAFYVFTNSSEAEDWWLKRISFGGGCVNNASWHVTNHHLPFGGRGFSGMGAYHGKHSFLTFSHQKSVMKTPTWFDPAVKYPPFKGKLKWFKMIIR